MLEGKPSWAKEKHAKGVVQGSLGLEAGVGMAGGRGGSLVTTSVDGADILEAEVPFQAGFNKGRHKATAGSIHMDLHIVPLAPQTRGMSIPMPAGVGLTLSGILAIKTFCFGFWAPSPC